MERTLRCIDCGGAFVHNYVTGAPPQRCSTCRPIRKRQVNLAKQTAWREANRERAREHWNKYNRKRLADPEYRRQKNDDRILREYGLSRDQYDALLQQQGGLCAICRGDRRGSGKTYFHIDHCHDSQKVRGLLCGPCNTAIGLLGDDPDRLQAAARYLRR